MQKALIRTRQLCPDGTDNCSELKAWSNTAYPNQTRPSTAGVGIFGHSVCRSVFHEEESGKAAKGESSDPCLSTSSEFSAPLSLLIQWNSFSKNGVCYASFCLCWMFSLGKFRSGASLFMSLFFLLPRKTMGLTSSRGHAQERCWGRGPPPN